jgi:hypothetical protein
MKQQKYLFRLPVHVNGALAIASNRKDLWRVDATDSENFRGRWNEALMKDPVSIAYVQLLADLTQLLPINISADDIHRFLNYEKFFENHYGSSIPEWLKRSDFSKSEQS